MRHLPLARAGELGHRAPSCPLVSWPGGSDGQDLWNASVSLRSNQSFPWMGSPILPGASNDYFSHLLHLAVPLLDPHIALINFTYTARREYLSVQNEYVPYFPSLAAADRVSVGLRSTVCMISARRFWGQDWGRPIPSRICTKVVRRSFGCLAQHVEFRTTAQTVSGTPGV